MQNVYVHCNTSCVHFSSQCLYPIFILSKAKFVADTWIYLKKIGEDRRNLSVYNQLKKYLIIMKK